MILDHPQIHDGQRDEDHLHVKHGVHEFLRGIDRHKDHSRGCIDPEADPQHRKEFFQRRKTHGRRESENPHVDACIDTDDESHANGMKQENARKCEE